jgi:hypothetical protein
MNWRIAGIFKNLFLPALITLILILSTKAAHAALSISYSVNWDTSSSIVYDPSVDAFLHGNNLTVTSLTGTDTQQNAGALTISNGTLNFQAGPVTGQTGNVWNIGSAGTITLQGEIPALSLFTSTTLLSGSFQAASVTVLPFGQSQFDIIGATFVGLENPNISQYFGIPANSTSTCALNLSFIGSSNAGGGFTSSNNFGGVVANDALPTPLPAAAWLFGSGLFGLFSVKRRVQL